MRHSGCWFSRQCRSPLSICTKFSHFGDGGVGLEVCVGMMTVGKSAQASAAIWGAAAVNKAIQNIQLMRPASKIPPAICMVSFIELDRVSILRSSSVSRLAELKRAIAAVGGLGTCHRS